MGIISRIHDFLNGTIANADEVDAEFNNIHELVNGELESVNLSPTAGVVGTQLADGTIITVKLANDAVTDAKLADHATLDSGRAVGTDHIKNLAVTGAKIGLNTVAAVNLKGITAQAVAFSQAVSAGATQIFTVTPGSPIIAANVALLGIYLENYNNPGLVSLVFWKELSGANIIGKIVFTNTDSGSETYTGNFVFVYMSNT